MSDIALYLDQDNELRFNVAIEGTKPGTPKYRLVFEGKNFSYTFGGYQAAPGEVAFVIPTMKNLMKEGNYRADLEVMIDDRFFTPLSFDASFEESVKVTAEAFVRPVAKKPAVVASIVTSHPAQEARPVLETTTPVRPKTVINQQPVSQKRQSADFIAEVDGKKITADDLRALLRAGK
jgi:hypothetical protein